MRRARRRCMLTATGEPRPDIRRMDLISRGYVLRADRASLGAQAPPPPVAQTCRGSGLAVEVEHGVLALRSPPTGPPRPSARFGISRSASASSGARLPRRPRTHEPRQQVQQQVVEGLEALLLGGERELVGRAHAPPASRPGAAPRRAPRCARRARVRRCPRVAGPAARCPRPSRSSSGHCRHGGSFSAAASAASQAPRAAPRPPAAAGPAGGSASGWSAAAGSARTRSAETAPRVGGSSSDFNSALAALMLSSSAASTITTRQAPSPAVSPRNDLSRLTSSTGMLAAKRLARVS